MLLLVGLLVGPSGADAQDAAKGAALLAEARAALGEDDKLRSVKTLDVKGDSMIQAGIHDGDDVLIKRSDTADSGDIVVALIDNEEATLKRLRKRGNSVALEAANPAYETRIFGPDRVRIQGKLVAMIRRYS